MSTWLGMLLLAAPALYAARMLALRRAWDRLPVPVLPPTAASSTASQGEPLRFSVIIAARNEADNLPLLLADLACQTLPAQQFEVLIVDDHSTDATATVAAAFKVPFALRVIQLAEVPGADTGKKAALQAALAQARAPWIVCTDADCRLHPDWLLSYAALQDEVGPEVRFVSGPVLLTGPETLLHSLSGLEFAGLVGTGAASIGADLPTMCNGANLAYRRDAFAAVAGFAGNEHLASGDDEFLMHKLHAAFPGSIRFLKHPAALVRTAGPPTLAALLRQRVRWASKWRHYRHSASQQLAVLVLLANLALAAGALALPWLPALAPWAATAWLLKLGADVWFLSPVLAFLERRRWLWWVPVLQLAYAPYALAVGLAGLRGGYVWKGRAVR
ncbi:glycosyltransferase [Hymenobacter sediminicola]|uniref:Glycosyltransferase n=1 Tax=Hymenobacter sediminicola TaxID=2761579 RepID=A0A7G7W3S1_9BACT|nr:glycosyltransferase [Hymenobacter sediminicola]QNH61014.1 glycosyltransferase [Hymenobacter sediminicola]